MNNELVFYTHPMSRGRIVRWMLEEVGQPYKTELLDYGTTMKAPAYLAINPMGKVPALLHEFQRERVQSAIVVDEYGEVMGLVTLEDIIEEIVGDVRDEHDDATPDVIRAGNGWQVSGLLRTDEVAEETGFRAPDGEYETIGGLVLAELGHIPQAGESVELTEFDPDGDPERPVRWLATVAAMDGRRIDQLHLTELGPRGLDGGRR